MGLMTRKFYRVKDEPEVRRALIDKIANGLILSDFEEQTGRVIGNSYAKLFVTQDELDKEWEQFNYVVPYDFKEDQINKLVTLSKKLQREATQYGAFEDANEDWRSVESEIHALKAMFEGRFKTKGEFEEYLKRRCKDTFPEDYADEICWGEAFTFYMFLFDCMDEMKRLFSEGDNNESK